MAIEKPYELKQRRLAEKQREKAVGALEELIMAAYTPTVQNTSGPISQTGVSSSSTGDDSVNDTTAASRQEIRDDITRAEVSELEREDGSDSDVRSPQNGTGIHFEDLATRRNNDSSTDFVRRKVSRLGLKDKASPSLDDILNQKFGIVGDAYEDEDVGRVEDDASVGEPRTVSRLGRSSSDRLVKNEEVAETLETMLNNGSQDQKVATGTTRNHSHTTSTSTEQILAIMLKSHQTHLLNLSQRAKESKQRGERKKQKKDERLQERRNKQQQRQDEHGERQREKSKQKQKKKKKEKAAEESSEEDQFRREVLKVVKRLESKTWQLAAVRSWDGLVDQEDEVQWSFAGAMLYSVTVVTTIGE